MNYFFSYLNLLKLSSYVNARLSKYFDDPLSFIPERFLKDSNRY
jgi:hypothetical protein